MKLMLVSSSGGHISKLYLLKNWWSRHDRVWVTRNDTVTQSLLTNEDVHFAFFPDKRSIPNLLKNTLLAFSLIHREKPDIVVSFGAGVSVPFLVVAKVLKIKTVFVETFIFIEKKTLSGRILENVVDIFLVQNKKLQSRYKKSQFWGAVI